MRLEDKGKILPPPILQNPYQAVSETIQAWDSIISATHWSVFNGAQVDGADFYVGEEELGHIHLDGELHLPCTTALKKPLLKNKLAQSFPYGEGWVQFKIKSKNDIQHAVWLFQLNYKRICGIPIEQLITEIDQLENA